MLFKIQNLSSIWFLQRWQIGLEFQCAVHIQSLLLDHMEGSQVILSLWWHVIFHARMRHISLLVSLAIWLVTGVMVPGLMCLGRSICYVLMLISYLPVFLLFFHRCCLESSIHIMLHLFPSVRLLVQAMTFCYFRNSKDVFVKISNGKCRDSLLGIVTLSVGKMLFRLMYFNVTFCLDKWQLGLPLYLIFYWYLTKENFKAFKNLKERWGWRRGERERDCAKVTVRVWFKPTKVKWAHCLISMSSPSNLHV